MTLQDGDVERILAALSELVAHQGKLLCQNEVIVKQLNRHTDLIVRHEQAIMRCMRCKNWSDVNEDDTTRVVPFSEPTPHTMPALKPQERRSALMKKPPTGRL